MGGPAVCARLGRRDARTPRRLLLHPWAWNEIGFGGPAYPRGYARLGPGQRESWESPPEFSLDPIKDVRERGLE